MRTTRCKVVHCSRAVLALVVGASACGSDKKESTSTSGGRQPRDRAHRPASSSARTRRCRRCTASTSSRRGTTSTCSARAAPSARASTRRCRTARPTSSIDYTGSAASDLDKTGKPSPDPAQTYTRLQAAIKKAYPTLTGLDYAKKAEDKNAFVVLKTFADENNLKTISDVKKVENKVTFGGSAQCSERTDCLIGYQKRLRPEVQGHEGDHLRTSAGRGTQVQRPAGDPVPDHRPRRSPRATSWSWTEDKGIFSADNVVPVLTSKLAANQDLIKAINDPHAEDHEQGPPRLEREHRRRQGRSGPGGHHLVEGPGPDLGRPATSGRPAALDSRERSVDDRTPVR